MEIVNEDEYLENPDDQSVLGKLMKDLVEYNEADDSKHRIDDGPWVKDTAADVREHNLDLITQMVDRWDRVQGALNNE